MHQLPQTTRPFDVTRRFVRFRGLRDDGFVEFDFAIGEPEVSVELILPLAEYREFCQRHNVVYLTRDENEVMRLLDSVNLNDELYDRHLLQGVIDAD